MECIIKINKLLQFILQCYLISLFFCKVNLWQEESIDMGCLENNQLSQVSNQGECQDNCETNDGCVGISYSHTSGFTNYCFVCMNDVLSDVINGFGFYRRPGESK